MYIKIIYKSLIPEKTRISIKIFIRKIISLKYKGDNVRCNCCNKHFSEFLPYGDTKIKRLNAACPWCNSLERTRMLWSFLNKSDFLKKNTKVLHFAPAKIIEKLLKNNTNITYLSCDINPALAMDQADITSLKYANSSFNLIICGHVLSVVKQEKKALEELYRVLKKGGTLIILEHIYKEFEQTYEEPSILNDLKRKKYYGQPYLERLYGKDFIKRPEKVGFTVNTYDYKNELTQTNIDKFGFNNAGFLFLCTK